MLLRLFREILRRPGRPARARGARREHDAAADDPLAALIGAGRLEEAASLLEQAGAQAGHAACTRLADALRRAQRYVEACRWYRAALATRPDDAEGWLNLGVCCYRSGEPHLAHQYFRAADFLRPRDADILNEKALVEMTLGNVEDAERSLENAVNANPAHPEAWNNLGNVCAAYGNRRQAHRCFLRAAELRPDFYTALCNLGLSHRYLEQLEEAEQVLRRAAALQPDAPEARLNLAMVLQDRGELDAALAQLEGLAAAHPERADILVALGALHLRLGQPEPAEAHLRRALELAPGDAEAMLGLAHVQLATERYAEGWRNYEARLRSAESPRRRFAIPPWNGEPVAGRRVLVYGEQGLGDTILFASCLPDLLRETASCVLSVEPRLRRLFGASFPKAVLAGEEIRKPGAPGLGPIDFVLPIGSLPGIYRPSREAFPAHQGYLHADPARRARWRARLEALAPGLRVGVTWRGGKVGTGRALRSLEAGHLAPLLAAPAVRWVNLEHTASESELAALAERAGATLQDWREAHADFDEFAALVASLDLVISACSTTAHVAGALGVPVWVLAPYAPAWRYLLRGERLPWYPSARMLRQPRPGDWDAVLRAAQEALAPLARRALEPAA
jgi:Flp pilus assembly protein TadD